jgi:hypothetical protein
VDAGFHHIGGAMYENIALFNIIAELSDSTPDSFMTNVELYNNY